MASTTPPIVAEPVQIFKLAHRYLLYDVNVVTYLRREHNISGVLIGSLPQASQQNVFLGLPLELMPEEAQLLVEKGVGHIVDDVAEHKSSFLGAGLSADERKAYQAALSKQGQAAAVEANKRSDEKKKNAMKKAAMDNWNDIPDDMFQPTQRKGKRATRRREEPTTLSSEGSEDDLLFASPANSFPAQSIRLRTPSTGPAAPEPYGVTPTTSFPPTQSSKLANGSRLPLPDVPESYPLYRHLHENGYFLAPGLRFGCQYTAYPGDPLRFHSHFLCNGMEWDQEFDLLDLVGGGRLGTGVKKGFLIGGVEKESGTSVPTPDTKVRTFCIEWGGM